MCFSPQRRTIFQDLNFKKWSETVSFLTFWLGNVLLATAACNFSTLYLRKVLRECSVLYIFTWKMCFSPQRRTIFRHLNFKKWSGADVFCTFSLQNVLLATAACNFWFLLWPHDSAPAALTSLLFDSLDTRIIGKTQHFATSLTFGAGESSFFWLSRYCIFFLLTLLHLICFSSAFQLSILSEVYYLNFLRWYCYIRQMILCVHAWYAWPEVPVVLTEENASQDGLDSIDVTIEGYDLAKVHDGVIMVTRIIEPEDILANFEILEDAQLPEGVVPLSPILRLTPEDYDFPHPVQLILPACCGATKAWRSTSTGWEELQDALFFRGYVLLRLLQRFCRCLWEQTYRHQRDRFLEAKRLSDPDQMGDSPPRKMWQVCWEATAVHGWSIFLGGLRRV